MTSTTATQTGPGRPAIDGRRIEIKLENDLLDQLDAYATEHGLRRPDALRALLRAGLEAATPQQDTTIRDLFPEADGASDDELADLVAAASDGRGDADEYAQDGRPICVRYHLVRGHWVVETETMTGSGWDHTYLVCADERQAQRHYREAMATARG